MWRRNILFIALLTAGLAGLGAALATTSRSTATSNLRHTLHQRDDLTDVVTRVNASFEQSWKQQGLLSADPASDLTVARRLSLALVGVTPSLEEIRRIESQPEQTRLSWYLASLLEDGRTHAYLAERMARTYVGVQNGAFLVYRRHRFVSWLAEELKQSRPYDQLVYKLIADDGLWTDHPATNFITVTIDNQKDKPNPAMLAARVSRAFLGVRLDCAECHDHPFAPWRQEDFQQLEAFFGQTEQSLRGVRDNNRPFTVEDRVTGDTVTIEPGVPFLPELLPADPKFPRRRLAAWVTHPNNEAFARVTVNRFWAYLCGKPLVEPVDDVPPDGDSPEALKILADDFVDHGYDLRRLIQAIVSTNVFLLDSRSRPNDPTHEITPAHEAAWAVFPLSRLRSEQVAGGILQAASLETIDHDSHIVSQLATYFQQNDFIERYGDAGEAELEPQGGAIPQRLLLMNGKLVNERTGQNPLLNACSRIAMLAPNNSTAIETAYLAVLTRRPTEPELSYFIEQLEGVRGRARNQAMEDLYWTLLNATEFSWNH